MKVADPVINILSIGGRDCLELAILLDWFSRHLDKKLYFVMADIDVQAITGCRFLYQNYLSANINFICADVTYVGSAQLPRYHGIIMRHPQFWDSKTGAVILDGEALVKYTLHYLLHPQGSIFTSFYHQAEMEYFQKSSENVFLPRQFLTKQYPNGSYIFPAPTPRHAPLIFDHYTAILQ